MHDVKYQLIFREDLILLARSCAVVSTQGIACSHTLLNYKFNSWHYCARGLYNEENLVWDFRLVKTNYVIVIGFGRDLSIIPFPVLFCLFRNAFHLFPVSLLAASKVLLKKFFKNINSVIIYSFSCTKPYGECVSSSSYFLCHISLPCLCQCIIQPLCFVSLLIINLTIDLL